MNGWMTRNKWQDECSILSKILSLLLCDPSACSMVFLSPEWSDCDSGGVILEKEKNAK